MKDLAEQAGRLLDEQTRDWELFRSNRAAAEGAPIRSFDFGQFAVRVQLNPQRLTSTLAQTGVDEKRERPCVLCDVNRPTEQKSLPCGDFKLLCNPYPVLPRHFTIVHQEHRPQRILDGINGMLEISRALGEQFVVFYNGPSSGASAPDHLHLQAAARGVMPVDSECSAITKVGADYLRRFIAIESSQIDIVRDRFASLYQSFRAIQPDQVEPMMNVICSHDANGWRLLVFPRAGHRPALYIEPEHSRLLISPGTVEMGGIITTPMERDFQRITREHIVQMYQQVTLPVELFQRLTA